MSKTIKIPETLFRSAQFERSAINEEARTVELSISSEAPYKRYFGTEILDHKAECVKLERFATGAPLLFNHNCDAHIGRIIETRLENGKLVVKAKFGNSAFANEKWQDVKDGILKETSVGYQVSKMVLEEEKDDECTYRVTEWTPYEGSLVTIPADPSVGVGRSENLRELEISIKNEKPLDGNSQICENNTTKTTTMPTEPITPPAPNIEVTRAEAVSAERKRVADIQELNTHFQQKGIAGRRVDCGKLADEMIRDGKTVQDFQNAVIRAELPEMKPITTSPEIGMEKKDLDKYSIVRAINLRAANKPLDGLEKDCNDAASKLLGKQTNGFFIPHDVMAHRALTTNVFSAAGAFVQAGNQGQSMIELYRNQMCVVQMGARVLTGLQGNLAIPSQTGGATASWLSEDGTITASAQTVGQVSLTPHRLVGATAYTQQLLAQSSIDVESFVRNDLMAVLAIAKDLAALKGTGVSGQPLGIYGTANKSTSVTLAGANSMIYADAVQFETNVATNNAAVGSLGYLTSIATRGNSKLVAEISAANSIPVWKNDTVNGYKALATNQLTTLPSVIFGNWSDLIIGDWSTNEVLVDPFSLSLQGQIRVVMQQLTDVAIRHPKSFSISTT